MTGPEHYQAAERLLEGRDSQGRKWTDAGWFDLVDGLSGRATLRQAQLAEAAVHMGLAQAAAVITATPFSSGFYAWPGQCDSLGQWAKVVTGP